MAAAALVARRKVRREDERREDLGEDIWQAGGKVSRWDALIILPRWGRLPACPKKAQGRLEAYPTSVVPKAPLPPFLHLRPPLLGLHPPDFRALARLRRPSLLGRVQYF